MEAGTMWRITPWKPQKGQQGHRGKPYTCGGDIMGILLSHAVEECVETPSQLQCWLDLEDDDGMTALGWAATRGDEASVDALLRHGAAVPVRTGDDDAAKGHEGCST